MADPYRSSADFGRMSRFFTQAAFRWYWSSLDPVAGVFRLFVAEVDID